MKRIVLAVVLLFAVSTFAQSPKEVRDRNYQQLFAMSAGIFDKLPKVCKTETCATLAAVGAKHIADGRDKYARDILVNEERAAWHAKLESTLRASINELQAGIVRKRGAIPAAAVHQSVCLTPVQGGDACQQCYDVFEVTAEICALYTIVSPEAALICLATATLSFGGCVNHWCNPEINIDQTN